MATLTYTGTLRVTSCWCGIHMAIPDDLYAIAQREGKSVFCPRGHSFVYRETTTTKLKQAEQRLKEERARLQATRDLLHQEERSHAATRGHVTRKKRELSRVKAGVCPCCNRSFQNLARHMSGKHPDFKP